MSICPSRKWPGDSLACRCSGNSDSLRTKRWTASWPPCSRSVMREPKALRRQRINSAFDAATKLACGRYDDNSRSRTLIGAHQCRRRQELPPAFLISRSAIHIPHLNVPLAEQPRQRSAKPFRWVQLPHGTPISAGPPGENHCWAAVTSVGGPLTTTITGLDDRTSPSAFVPSTENTW